MSNTLKKWNGELLEAMRAAAIKPSHPKKDEKLTRIMHDDNYVCQRKLNGERLLTFKRSTSYDVGGDEIQAIGRNFSKTGEPMWKTKLIPHILNELQDIIGEVVLDGEVIFIPNQNELTLQQIKQLQFSEDFWACRSIMGYHLYPENGVQAQEEVGKLHYLIYDVLVFKGEIVADLPYKARLEILDYINKFFIASMKYVHIVDVAISTQDKYSLLNKCVDIGLEGVIAKNLTHPYLPGKKPANTWVKIKKEEEADGIIIGYKPAEQFTEVIQNGKKLIVDGVVVQATSRFYQNKWIGSLWIAQWSKTPPDDRHRNIIAEFNKDANEEYLHAMCELCALGKEDQNIPTMIRDGETYYLIPVTKMSGMTDALRAEISANKSAYIGKVVQFKYFEKTDCAYYIPSFTCFRDDKPLKDCVWE